MKRLNYHKKIGLAPGLGFIWANYGKHKVLGLRFGWSAVTVSF